MEQERIRHWWEAGQAVIDWFEQWVRRHRPNLADTKYSVYRFSDRRLTREDKERKEEE